MHFHPIKRGDLYNWSRTGAFLYLDYPLLITLLYDQQYVGWYLNPLYVVKNTHSSLLTYKPSSIHVLKAVTPEKVTGGCSSKWIWRPYAICEYVALCGNIQTNRHLAAITASEISECFYMLVRSCPDAPEPITFCLAFRRGQRHREESND